MINQPLDKIVLYLQTQNLKGIFEESLALPVKFLAVSDAIRNLLNSMDQDDYYQAKDFNWKSFYIILSFQIVGASLIAVTALVPGAQVALPFAIGLTSSASIYLGKQVWNHFAVNELRAQFETAREKLVEVINDANLLLEKSTAHQNDVADIAEFMKIFEFVFHFKMEDPNHEQKFKEQLVAMCLSFASLNAALEKAVGLPERRNNNVASTVSSCLLFTGAAISLGMGTRSVVAEAFTETATHAGVAMATGCVIM